MSKDTSAHTSSTMPSPPTIKGDRSEERASDSSSDDGDDGDDVVLSDIHIKPWAVGIRSSDPQTTVFQGRTCESAGAVSVSIQHCLATALDRVGLQVWVGALVLADYILANASLFHNQTVLELGAGTGLVSIVSAVVGAKEVFSTDLGEHGILDLIALNAEANSVGDGVSVRELDFTNDDALLWYPRKSPLVSASEDETGTSRASESCRRYAWTHSDADRFRQECSIVLAADIIYDDHVTFAFVTRIHALLAAPPKGCERVLFLALERRINFTVEIVAPAYDFLFETLEAWNAAMEDELGCTIVWTQIDLALVPQAFEYSRTPYLELWCMRLESSR
ncbi:uncharacterized protein BJ171DRAFT_511319 [Polychytrium aggregatum]|uniref:uncharacterized protein n=1 Tax=Polychytrium aggregatum TaxID=110093 RepID=UPI0022FEA352|nr:uncharacterized protein BJ171DRAFT_511319 [Polychytrium aggregatum]KAI9202930.1 hypothetical protein BJ171DRAFT_511319 [Polychytrium aggregatum]